jgi:hypothetical protein
MADDPKTRADARLEAALETATVRDPRPLYRPILRYLRERDPSAFERAIRHFDEELVPAVAGDADPLTAWLDFGHRHHSCFATPASRRAPRSPRSSCSWKAA